MPKIEVIDKNDSDYALFEACKDEQAFVLEECNELLGRFKLVEKKRNEKDDDNQSMKPA